MNLLTKTSRTYAIASIVILGIGTVLFYIALRHILNYNNDENLATTQNEIHRFIVKNGQLPPFFSTKEDVFEVKLWEDISLRVKENPILTDTFIANLDENGELEPYRQITFTERVGDANYQIKLSQLSIETEDLIALVVGLMVGIMGVLLLVLYFINRRISQNIWQPFEDTLQKIKHLRFENTPQSWTFMETDIKEFSELNTHLARMIERLQQDFLTLKEFTENASHEMQTPLAALQNRLELLLQHPELNADALSPVADALRQVKRLSRLSQTLLLMTKIDNHQFSDTKNINIETLILDKIDLFKPLMEDKNIQLKTTLLPTSPLTINPILADILISNLVSNAIRHNIKDGEITIQLINNQLIVKNTGINSALNDKIIFKRFKKSGNTEGVGLGLSLVEQICKNYGFAINYTFDAQFHCFSIVFD